LKGRLLVCATPIGNLGDASPRLIEVLRTVDLILAEDTRLTRKLLAANQIATRMLCLERRREVLMIPRVVGWLTEGKSIALVSDAGTPGLSDPGQQLIPRVIDRGIDVEYIPGPSAIIAALILSGLPLHTFLFHAFPPASGGPRRRLFQSLANLKATLVFFESPHRLLSSLDDLQASLGDRRAAVCREMTKLHEEILRGHISEITASLTARPKLQGEITIVVEGAGSNLTA
jgi:16S rRNA (cytidine1402-2'-O)-methyltransferase